MDGLVAGHRLTAVVNCAGIYPPTRLDDYSEDVYRRVFDVNVLGTLNVTAAAVPHLRAAGGGAVVNFASVDAFAVSPGQLLYSASKAALWSATNSLRLELAPQGVHVLGLHVGYVDTPMAAGAEGPKASPVDVVGQTYDGLESGAFEVLADETSRQVKSGLTAPLEAVYPQLTGA